MIMKIHEKNKKGRDKKLEYINIFQTTSLNLLFLSLRQLIFAEISR